MSDANVLYGQCACGATLTVEHLQRHCPLRPQQKAQDHAFVEEWWRTYLEGRLDTSHVAVLGDS